MPLFKHYIDVHKVDFIAFVFSVGVVLIIATWRLTHFIPHVTSSFARCSIRVASDDNVVDHIVANHVCFSAIVSTVVVVLGLHSVVEVREFRGVEHCIGICIKHHEHYSKVFLFDFRHWLFILCTDPKNNFVH